MQVRLVGREVGRARAAGELNPPTTSKHADTSDPVRVYFWWRNLVYLRRCTWYWSIAGEALFD